MESLDVYYMFCFMQRKYTGHDDDNTATTSTRQDSDDYDGYRWKILNYDYDYYAFAVSSSLVST